VNRRRGLDDWIAIGRAFHELRHEAMRQSNSKQLKGRRYKNTYALLELPPEIADLRQFDRSNRARIIWFYQNAEAVRAWYDNLGQNERDVWNHPQTIKLRYERMTARRSRTWVGTNQ